MPDPSLSRPSACFSPESAASRASDSSVRHQDLANAIRALAMDAVQKANSGHPGTPMALAPLAHVLWTRVMKYDAADPTWAPSVIKYTMPDNDVVEIDVSTMTVSRYFPRVGTVNLGLAIQPGSGDLFVANTDARNLTRFALKTHTVRASRSLSFCSRIDERARSQSLSVQSLK